MAGNAGVGVLRLEAPADTSPGLGVPFPSCFRFVVGLQELQSRYLDGEYAYYARLCFPGGFPRGFPGLPRASLSG